MLIDNFCRLSSNVIFKNYSWNVRETWISILYVHTMYYLLENLWPEFSTFNWKTDLSNLLMSILTRLESYFPKNWEIFFDTSLEIQNLLTWKWHKQICLFRLFKNFNISSYFIFPLGILYTYYIVIYLRCAIT